MHSRGDSGGMALGKEGSHRREDTEHKEMQVGEGRGVCGMLGFPWGKVHRK